MTYSKCRRCGHIEQDVCALFFGHRCEKCGAVDAASLHTRKGSR